MWNQHTLGDSPRPDHLQRIVPMHIPGALTLRPVSEGERSTPRVLRKQSQYVHSTHFPKRHVSEFSVGQIAPQRPETLLEVSFIHRKGSPTENKGKSRHLLSHGLCSARQEVPLKDNLLLMTSLCPAQVQSVCKGKGAGTTKSQNVPGVFHLQTNPVQQKQNMSHRRNCKSCSQPRICKKTESDIRP